MPTFQSSQEYVVLNWAAAGGGAFSILPLPSPWVTSPHNQPYKPLGFIPLARGHTAPVLDTTWSLLNDLAVALEVKTAIVAFGRSNPASWTTGGPTIGNQISTSSSESALRHAKSAKSYSTLQRPMFSPQPRATMLSSSGISQLRLSLRDSHRCH